MCLDQCYSYCLNGREREKKEIRGSQGTKEEREEKRTQREEEKKCKAEKEKARRLKQKGRRGRGE